LTASARERGRRGTICTASGGPAEQAATGPSAAGGSVSPAQPSRVQDGTPSPEPAARVALGTQGPSRGWSVPGVSRGRAASWRRAGFKGTAAPNGSGRRARTGPRLRRARGSPCRAGAGSGGGRTGTDLVVDDCEVRLACFFERRRVLSLRAQQALNLLDGCRPKHGDDRRPSSAQTPRPPSVEQKARGCFQFSSGLAPTPSRRAKGFSRAINR